MPAASSLGRLVRSHPPVEARTLLVGLVVAATAWATGCTSTDAPVAAVSRSEALDALEELHGLATRQTPAAMESICGRTLLTGCHGLSGATLLHPGSAPGPGTPLPSVLCSRNVGDGAWMLVVEGADGYGRPYVSQLVLDRDDEERVVPRHEAAYWLGIVYHGTKVAGPTGLTTAYSAQDRVDVPAQTEKSLRRARAACDRI